MKNKPAILYEDESVIIVNKPAGILSIPDRFKLDLPNIRDFLKSGYEQVYTLHRLDRETSGLMLFARNEEAHRFLSQQFENGAIDKTYRAIVQGCIQDSEGLIDKKISRHPGIPGKMMVSAKGKASRTAFKVLERFRNYSYVEIQLLTGRTHQIRVHFESIGHPLAVDPLYARKSEFFLSEIKGKKYKKPGNREERPLISRCTLHAEKLSFRHPLKKEMMSFIAETPKDFNALLKQLQKWGK